jgi:hypothetical protein
MVMTRVLTIDRRYITLAVLTLAVALAVAAVTQPAVAAEVSEETEVIRESPRPVEGEERSEKVVVVPEPPHWSGWGEWRSGQHRSAPRIKMWVDRGEWSTYYPGDRLWVYFRVDRPCYVTILDYSPDGRVSTIYPSRWSGSTFVSPGRTYRIPESRRYSLRIAGAGGVETLVACAHETPWPSGPGGAWIPQHHPNRGRVVVGRPGGSPPPGWRGRVVVGPGRWPVPPRWYDTPDLWSCDSVSFYVAGDGWHGSWYDRDKWRDGGRVRVGGCDEWDDRDRYRDWDDDTWRWDDDRCRIILHDRFRMNDCSDDYSCGLDIGPEDAVIRIDCVESSKGDPTEIVGRVTMEDHWGDDVIFRLDIEGEHGERPRRGRVYSRQWGDTRVEVEVTGYKVYEAKHWQVPRFKWMEFEVRVLGAGRAW